MLKWLRSLFNPPRPIGTPQRLRTFSLNDPTIAQDGITAEADSWRIELKTPQTIRLFEVSEPNVEQCLLTYRAKLKTTDLTDRAFLEMWCRIPGRGEFFSKGFHHAVKGTNNWASYEIPFFLKQGQKPDLIKLNVTVEGTGQVWIKDIELLQTPLSR